MTQTCTRNRVRVHDWIDGRLPEPRRDEVRRHLEGCPECLRHARETAALVRTLRSLPRNRAPGGVLEGVVSRLAAARIQARPERRPRPARRRVPFSSPRLSFLAGCTAAFLLGVAATLALTSDRGPSPDPGGARPVGGDAGELLTRSFEGPVLPGTEDAPGSWPGHPGGWDGSLVATPFDREQADDEARPLSLDSPLRKLAGPATGR